MLTILLTIIGAIVLFGLYSVSVIGHTLFRHWQDDKATGSIQIIEEEHSGTDALQNFFSEFAAKHNR